LGDPIAGHAPPPERWSKMYGAVLSRPDKPPIP